MPIYEFDSEEIRPVPTTTFSQAGRRERQDLQRLLRAKISVITDKDILIIAEEFDAWEGSRRRIDLVGIDRDANLVVIELKRTDDGGHMELQALRYAAMVSSMTFEQAVVEFDAYLSEIGDGDTDARAKLLDFLGWDEPDEDAFARDVCIILASADFGRELTTAVLWLIDCDIDIRCVRLEPYDLDGRILVDVRQIIPLPEAGDYQVRVAEKKRKEREARASANDLTRYDITLGNSSWTKLSKRKAIYHTFRYLVERGIEPEEVVEQFGPRGNRALMRLDGEVAAEDFPRLAEEARAKDGFGFDPRRFFCGEDQIVHFGGRTYAFTGEWGEPHWKQAMENLRDAFPDHGIEFTPSE